MTESNGRVYEVVGKDLLERVRWKQVWWMREGWMHPNGEDCSRFGEMWEPGARGKDRNGLLRCVQKASVVGALRETGICDTGRKSSRNQHRKEASYSEWHGSQRRLRQRADHCWFTFWGFVENGLEGDDGGSPSGSYSRGAQNKAGPRERGRWGGNRFQKPRQEAAVPSAFWLK